MDTADVRAQPYQVQRRPLRNVEDASTTSYPQAAATGTLLMSDTQGIFAFSSEPASIMYDGSTTNFPLTNASGQDFTFAPHAGPSIDSSLHPGMASQSYPPPNAYAHSQSYGLSPGSYYSNGQGVSPSHSTEHLSPEAGYVSDLSHHDISNYTTPAFNAQYLDKFFSNLNFVDNSSNSAFPPFEETTNMSLLSSGNLSTYNAQSPTASSNVPMQIRRKPVSTSATQASSPVVGEDSATFPALYHNGRSSHESTASSLQMLRSTHNSVPTSSPKNMGASTLRPIGRHMSSPIVRVENYSRDASPSASDNSRSLDKRSHNKRRSVSHLSPHPQDASSGEDEIPNKQIRPHRIVQSTERNEDGSWLSTGSTGLAGLNPGDRQALGDSCVPSIEEIESQRLKNEKKLEVQDWLIKSEVGSEADDEEHSNHLSLPSNGRPRAKSTNETVRKCLWNTSPQARAEHLVLGVRTDFNHADDSNIPGPGKFVYEQSDCETDDYDSFDNSDILEPESPPAAVSVLERQVDNPYFPPTKESMSIVGIVRPWVDEPAQVSTPSTHYQPPTSNAAMMRFWQRAKDVESASLAATVGSRRRGSESDIGSVRAEPGVTRLVKPNPNDPKRQRRPNFMHHIRTPSNLLKRKGSVTVQPATDSSSDNSKDPAIERPKRMGSWGRPRSPRMDSNHSNELNPLPSTAVSSPWYREGKKLIKRTRSRSELVRAKSPGLAELMTQHGGPPMPKHASPLATTEATKPSAQHSPAEVDDDDEQEIITMDLKVRTDLIIPTYEGFRSHARELNPRLSDFMVERVAQEQMRRFKRLLEFKVKHLNAVKNKKCSSGKFCTDLGGEAKQLPPRAGNKDPDAPFIGFQITAPGSSDEGEECLAEGTVVAAQFPSGVPLPPVKRLPAEFECPLCFKVKKFYKPSDWTKHVHEDVQPFTCTFPNCGEPKSFKRKADWVRHENERHRQLENWTCQITDCNHTCYRKDNFVQHLVREHKIAEPRARTGRAGNKDAHANGDPGNIWSIVDSCRHDTTKQPKDEPCRFCGNICTSWKKLTVHLAKHMEQISMPVLPLVEKRHVHADSIISPVVELAENRKFSATPSRSSIDKLSRGNLNSTLAPGLDPHGHYPQTSNPEVASTMMHTYPPPQMVACKNQKPAQNNGYTNYAANGAPSYANQTYPGLQVPRKPLNVYATGLQTPQQFYMQNDSQYLINPVSAVQQQAIFTNSPVETTAFPNYFTQEPQNLANDMLIDYDTASILTHTGNGMQYQQQGGSYPAMQYMTGQNGYQY